MTDSAVRYGLPDTFPRQYPKVVEKYEQHYSLELCFSIEKQAETVLSGGVFRIGARGSGQVAPLLNGCNDFDETLME